MPKALKITLRVFICIVIWLLVLVGAAMNLNNIFATLYETKYDTIGYPQNEVLLIGSSSIQNWRTSESDLGPLRSVNLGLSGSVVADWQPLVDRLVTPFHAKAVVIYIGANDIHSKNPTEPALVADELNTLIDKIHEGQPDARIYYVTVYAAGAFPDSRADEKALTAAMFESAQERDYLSVIDCAAALIGSDGEIRDDLFQGDQVHINEKGYAVWAKTIRDALMDDFGEGEG
jgi:lysophospholipase L1-like esterase